MCRFSNLLNFLLLILWQNYSIIYKWTSYKMKQTRSWKQHDLTLSTKFASIDIFLPRPSTSKKNWMLSQHKLMNIEHILLRNTNYQICNVLTCRRDKADMHCTTCNNYNYVEAFYVFWPLDLIFPIDLVNLISQCENNKEDNLPLYFHQNNLDIKW